MNNIKNEKLNRTLREKERWKKRLMVFGISTLLLLFLVGGYALNQFNQFGNNIYLDMDGENKEAQEEFGISDLFNNTFEEPITVLVLGVDTREDQEEDDTSSQNTQTNTQAQEKDLFAGARSDTIMVMSLNPYTKKVATVSFPRDSYVRVPGYGYTKINHAMAYGGIPLLKQTIEENFDLEVDHYLAIDFHAFTEVVDTLGGLTVYTPSPMYYVASDIHVELKPGYHHLKGEELLGYVRYRHDAAGDLGRIKRQQFVIRALSEKATSIKTLIKAPQLLDILGNHINTDLGKQDLLSIVKTYRSFSKDDWSARTLNGTPARAEFDNLWYYFFKKEDKEEVTDYINNHQAEE